MSGPGTTPASSPRYVLTLETTCDETAAAVVIDVPEVISSVVASQDALHERFGGVVPEIASRAHVERILPVIDEALAKAEVSLEDLSAIAVAHTPGLAGSLLVGLVAAKSLALALDIPLIAVDHLQAHVYAGRLAARRDIYPCVGLVVSGGHTSLFRCDSPLDFVHLGSTIDDAAGEAFDKVASMLSLSYPGGPSIERAARNGDGSRYAFPRSFIDDETRLDFSFSGLKTAVRYQLVGPGHADFAELELDEQQVADLAASFQEAVVDCLVAKASLALKQAGLNTLCVGGGVAANGRLRERLADEAMQSGFELIFPPMSLCTDNAAMGAIAIERLGRGETASLELDVRPGLVREPTAPTGG
ncbi:MAG: tRNA (adenosine(37)-N6)-threonylcarbamoyltransferase complex transferase subunit TsaD [Planctomycetota bacterium]|nr:MAG: tRNA (adenosine(37)-N6)-threonylcarbamoyltransferase complex transferase subunit TsaD [Planctomycetota bacterium]REK22200.1 MAG: tRNA (adenosine(37)-N6)-threonylcarbamoyltransferase complex transferase subunit TsaD [Planctomycetota bacterium]REK44278.1 MAG: tRNA (adenosine(37)-N6)-threonylcarbamoyltransferase complex transferase subunit TsaD [Planctomycetota bacterium]